MQKGTSSRYTKMSHYQILLLVLYFSANAIFTLAYRLSDYEDRAVNAIVTEAAKAIRHNPNLLFRPVNVSMVTDANTDPFMTTLSEVPRRPIERKKWGDDIPEYWFNNRIHTFGNTGLFGGLHAAMAPGATKLIDDLAYNGMDARVHLAEKICQSVHTKKARILDLCCGVGCSTRALQEAFPDAEAVIGLDTSPEMIAMARFMTSHIEGMRRSSTHILVILKQILPNSEIVQRLAGDATKRAKRVTSFIRGNAHRTVFPDNSFDLVTIMYAFHEAPKHGRYLMLREARRLLDHGGKIFIVDICPSYVPSATSKSFLPYHNMCFAILAFIFLISTHCSVAS